MIEDSINKGIIGRGDRSDDVYILNVDSFFMSPMEELLQGNYSLASDNKASASVKKISTQICHHRLGHLSSKSFELLKHQLKCDSSKWNNNEPCYICPLAKQKRLPFISHNKLSKFPFGFNHCDI